MAEIPPNIVKKMGSRIGILADTCGILLPEFNNIDQYTHFAEYVIDNHQSRVLALDTEDSRVWLQNSNILADRLNSIPSAFFHHELDPQVMRVFVSDLGIFNDLWARIAALP